MSSQEAIDYIKYLKSPEGIAEEAERERKEKEEFYDPMMARINSGDIKFDFNGHMGVEDNGPTAINDTSLPEALYDINDWIKRFNL